MEEIQIEVGRTYHNGEKHYRRVVGFHSYFVLYKTASGRSVTGVPIWTFKKWAKGVVEQ